MTDWLSKIKEISVEDSLGEIVSSSNLSFKFQVYNLKRSPEYSSIVIVLAGDILINGVITSIQMNPKDALALGTPSPLKRTREQIEKDYADIKDKLVMTCEAVIIGYYENGKFYQKIPRQIPWIHDLVFQAPSQYIRDFHIMNNNYKLSYLPLVYNSLSKEEKISFSFFMDTFIGYISLFFEKEEMDKIIRSIQESLILNGLDYLIENLNEIYINL
jgi:hypothetical protein